MDLSFPIGRLFGIPIRVHVSWFVVLVLVTAGIGAEIARVTDAGVLTAAALGLVGAGLLFLSVLLHELGHSVLALAFGIRVRRILLFIFGGVAEIVGEPRRVRDEVLIAAAGPAVSFALAFLAVPIVLILRAGSAPHALAQTLLMANLGLGVFNLIPAFPMDGGRIFRAVLWGLTGNYRRATSWAAGLGVAFAALLVLGGALTFFARAPDEVMGARVGGIWMAFIGLFLGRSAMVANTQGRISAALREATVADVMLRFRVAGTPAQPLAAVLASGADRALPDGSSGEGDPASGFPVFEGGVLVGFVEPWRIDPLPPLAWGRLRAGDVMTPASQMLRIGLDEPLDGLVRLLGDLPRAGVLVYHGDDLVGYASRGDVLR